MEEVHLSDTVTVETEKADDLRIYNIYVDDSYVTLMSDEADGLLEFIKETINNE